MRKLWLDFMPRILRFKKHKNGTYMVVHDPSQKLKCLCNFEIKQDRFDDEPKSSDQLGYNRGESIIEVFLPVLYRLTLLFIEYCPFICLHACTSTYEKILFKGVAHREQEIEKILSVGPIVESIRYTRKIYSFDNSTVSDLL